MLILMKSEFEIYAKKKAYWVKCDFQLWSKNVKRSNKSKLNQAAGR